MDEKDLSLLYRPQINIERDYRSDGVILHEPVQNVPEEIRQETLFEPDVPDEITQAIQTQQETAKKLLQIRKLTEVLPPKAQQPTNELIDTLLVQIGIEIPQLEEIIPEENEYEVHLNTATPELEPESEVLDTEKWPILQSSGFVFAVEKNKDSWDLAIEQHLLDSTMIKENFVEEYNEVFQRYVYQLVTAMNEIGLQDPSILNREYEGESVTGIPMNSQHLNDIIARNQDSVNEFADLFRKTHDANTTEAVLTQFDVVSKERIRYLKEQYKNETPANYIEMYDKNFLAESRDEYDLKYKDARTNYFRFLHSAVQMTGEMLALHLKSMISKCSLLSKNVNVFTKKEYNVEKVTNSTAMQIVDETKDKAQTKTAKQATEKQPNKNKPKQNSKQKQTNTKNTKKTGTNNNTKIPDWLFEGVGGGFGGAIKNNTQDVTKKTKNDASGTVKQTGNKINITPIAIKTKDKIKDKGQST